MGSCCSRPASPPPTLPSAAASAPAAAAPAAPSEQEMMDVLARLPRPGSAAQRQRFVEALRCAEPGRTPLPADLVRVQTTHTKTYSAHLSVGRMPADLGAAGS